MTLLYISRKPTSIKDFAACPLCGRLAFGAYVGYKAMSRQKGLLLKDLLLKCRGHFKCKSCRHRSCAGWIDGCRSAWGFRRLIRWTALSQWSTTWQLLRLRQRSHTAGTAYQLFVAMCFICNLLCSYSFWTCPYYFVYGPIFWKTCFWNVGAISKASFSRK